MERSRKPVKIGPNQYPGELKCLAVSIQQDVVHHISTLCSVPYSEVVITCDFESHIRSSNLRGARFFLFWLDNDGTDLQERLEQQLTVNRKELLLHAKFALSKDHSFICGSSCLYGGTFSSRKDDARPGEDRWATIPSLGFQHSCPIDQSISFISGIDTSEKWECSKAESWPSSPSFQPLGSDEHFCAVVKCYRQQT
jgi:hypothetical protein